MKQAMWKCTQHGTFDAIRTAACPECFGLMRQALEVFADPESWNGLPGEQNDWAREGSAAEYAQKILDVTK